MLRLPPVLPPLPAGAAMSCHLLLLGSRVQWQDSKTSARQCVSTPLTQAWRVAATSRALRPPPTLSLAHSSLEVHGLAVCERNKSRSPVAGMPTDYRYTRTHKSGAQRQAVEAVEASSAADAQPAAVRAPSPLARPGAGGAGGEETDEAPWCGQRGRLRPPAPRSAGGPPGVAIGKRAARHGEECARHARSRDGTRARAADDASEAEGGVLSLLEARLKIAAQRRLRDREKYSAPSTPAPLESKHGQEEDEDGWDEEKEKDAIGGAGGQRGSRCLNKRAQASIGWQPAASIASSSSSPANTAAAGGAVGAGGKGEGVGYWQVGVCPPRNDESSCVLDAPHLTLLLQLSSPSSVDCARC